MARTFTWDANTKQEDMPAWLRKLIPSTANLDDLDCENQFDHIIYRVQHEIDIADEEGLEETGMNLQEYKNAKKFINSVVARSV